MIDIFKEEYLYTLIVILIAIISYGIIKKVIKKIINNKHINKKKQGTLTSFFINISRFTVIIFAILFLLEIYGVDTATIIASLGVVGLVAGLAVKDILEDFVTGVALVFDDTYNIGDWVTINNFKGEIIEIGIRTTRIKSYTGDVLIINNGDITSVINHSIANINILVDVNISFDADLNKVEKVLNEYCLKMKDEVEDLKGEFTLLGLEEIDDSSLVYRILIEVANGSQFATKRNILKTLKEELDENNIIIPYKQLVIHERV